MDQLFSILTTHFKTEIQTPEHLLTKIENSNISPKPVVKELLFTWNWRDYVMPKLSDRKLKNHSFFYSFIFKKENGKAIMRYKKYPQHTEWKPAGGILLLKDNPNFTPIPVSPFRVESLNLDKVYGDLVTKYFPTLEQINRREVETSWERTKVMLENLPKRIDNLPKMNLQSLPRQTMGPIPTYPSYLKPFLDKTGERELYGQECIEEPVDGDFHDEIQVDMDVVVYSETKAKRPWVGRVRQLLKGSREFEIQWYERKNKGLTFYPSVNKDGTPLLSIVSMDSVMFWEFTEKNDSDNSFKIGQERLAKIMDDYKSHDQCYV